MDQINVNIKDLNPESLATKTPLNRRAVLIDDDKIYRQYFRKMGEKVGVGVTCYNSLEDMYSLGHLSNFDFAFLDFHLDFFKGTEIAEYVDIFFPDLPVFIVSADPRVLNTEKLPSCVKTVFLKIVSPLDILKDALVIVDQIDFYKRIAKR